MRITYKHLLIVLDGYLVYYIYQNIKLVNTPVKRTLIDKVTSSDKYGKVYYNYKFSSENGEIIYIQRSFESSISYELGKTYIFNTQKIKFK